MKPTPAQIKAAISAFYDLSFKYEDIPAQMEAALTAAAAVCPQCGRPADNNGAFQCRCTGTAAAEVGEHKPYRITDRMLADCLDREKTVEARTIERCAQVADTFDAELDPATYTAADIAAAIRDLKDK